MFPNGNIYQFDYRNIFLYEFFWPWKGIPKGMNTQPIYFGFDETISGNKHIINVRPKFNNPYYLETILARYDDGTGTPQYGTHPKIELQYTDESQPQQTPPAIDIITTPNEGNQYFKSVPFQMYFYEGRKNFKAIITEFGLYTHLAIAFKGRIEIEE